MAKKRGKKDFHRRLPGILWFVLGILITLWTLLWLLISMNIHNGSKVTPVILFGIGFYSMCIFILGTLIYYIFRGIKKIKNKKDHRNKVKKSGSKKSKSVSTHSSKLKKKSKKPIKKKTSKKKPSKKKK